ncbi:MAG: hypothetical protein K9N23_10570 [Akkermansiaceae bacterium]|nr:hypothetical protein [Akkermansiaceae bacterium]
MPDPTQHFIDTALRPLAGDEAVRAAAEVGLRARIAASGTGRDEELAEAAATLEAADRHPWRKHWQGALVGLMLAVSPPLLGGLALPFHHAEERYWTQADDLTRVPPDVVAWNRYEGDLLPILRQETMELLKPLDALAK